MGEFFMKKVFKILGVGFLSIIILLVSSAFVFGSTKHSDLTGSEEKKVKQFMSDFTKKKKFDGTVLVLHKGKVIFDESYGFADKENKLAFTDDLPFPIGSITKSMTATAILQLEEKGKLSVSDKLSKYMPDFPNSKKITIANLLNHSSGLIDFLEVDEIKNKYTKYHSEKEIFASFKDKPLKSEPGDKYTYVNSDYYLLGKIIEIVSGEKYSTYLQKHIFDRAGMNKTFILNDENSSLMKIKGYENGKLTKNLHPSLLYAIGDVISTKSDLSKYILALENNQLLTKKQLSKMTSPTIKIRGNLMGYGYGWYVADSFLSFDEKQYSHGGSLPGMRSGLVRFPDKDLTIIFFSNNGEAWNYVEPANEIASILFDKRMWFIHKLQ